MASAGIRIHLHLEFAAGRKPHTAPPFLFHVDLTLPGTGVTAIFGHSGSGKTTLLRCLAGLQQATGEIHMLDETWQGEGIYLPVHQRPLGYVFQEASLLPHLTGHKNLAFALKRSKQNASLDEQQHIIELMGIKDVLPKRPEQMSGGERQRVAIARALMIKPKVLLFDEPLAALDQSRKQEILPYLERLKSLYPIPIIYVTHSANEVARLADYLVVMSNGRDVAQGPISEVLNQLDLPIKLGEDTGVVVHARICEKLPDWHLLRAEFNGGQLWVRDDGDQIGNEVRIRVLARDVSLAQVAHRDSSIVNLLQGSLVAIVDDEHPAMCLSRIKVGEQFIIARTTKYSVYQLGLAIGSAVWLQIKSVAIVR